MKKEKIVRKIKIWIMIVIGTGLLACSVKCIYDPSKMVTGGFSGLAIIIKALTSRFFSKGIPLGVTTFLMNVPVFLIAYPLKGWRFVRRTLAATILVSLWLLVLPEVVFMTRDYVLTSVFGGVIGGIGIGLVLATGSATGGTDMIATLLYLKFPSYSIAQIMAVLDGIVILAGAFLFGFPVALYAVTSVYITSKISDGIVGGLHYAKCVYIITNESESMAKEIMNKLHRGVTAIYSVGMYTQQEKKILFCVVSKKEIVQLKNLVSKLDDKAFVIVSDVKEVLGEGFVSDIEKDKKEK